MYKQFSFEHLKLEEFTHAQKVTSHLSNDGSPADGRHGRHPTRQARSGGKPLTHLPSFMAAVETLALLTLTIILRFLTLAAALYHLQACRFNMPVRPVLEILVVQLINWPNCLILRWAQGNTSLFKGQVERMGAHYR